MFTNLCLLMCICAIFFSIATAPNAAAAPNVAAAPSSKQADLDSDYTQSKSHFSGLPLWSSLLEGKNVKLPLPFGVQLVRIDLQAPISVEDVDVKYRGREILDFDTSLISTSDVKADNYSVRADALIFPFLDVYAFVGNTDGSINVSVKSPISLPFIGRPVLTQKVDFSGITYGAGFSFIVGAPITEKGSAFFMADANFSWTDLDITDTLLSNLIMSYRLGWDTYIDGFNVQVWGGAMNHYATQTAELKVSSLGNIPLLDDFSADIEVADNSGHTPMIGAAFNFTEHIGIIIEQRFGDRELLNTALQIRF